MAKEAVREAESEEGSAENSAQAGMLEQLGMVLADKRAEAIRGRQSSGIEDIWMEDEEYYEGFDEENRGEDGRGTWRQKPPGRLAPKATNTTQSTVFPNITGPFTDAATARLADMLLPTDDRNWALSPTPIPDLVKMSKGKVPSGLMQQLTMSQAQPPSPSPTAPATSGPTPSPSLQGVSQGTGDGAAQGGAPQGSAPQGQMQPSPAGQPPAEPMNPSQQLRMAVKQAAAEQMSEARFRAELAETQIADWHAACQYNAQIRKVIEDTGRIGTGVIKGPVPVMNRRVAMVNGKMTMIEEVIPGSVWVDPWNFYPDPSCGENIHSGGYTFEKDHLTRRQLTDLKSDPDYIPEQIDACLKEGPTKASKDMSSEGRRIPGLDAVSDQPFEVWYFHGVIDRESLEACGCDCSEMGDLLDVPAVVTMVNNRPIKATLNPLDTGEFPYDVMVWRRRSGHWTGIGVARQIRTPQKMIVGATRHLMDNAGIAAGPMLVFKQGSVYPADGKMGFSPRKIFYLAEDSELIDDVRKAIGTIKIDMVLDELLKLIELGMRFAEDTTGLPMIIQGQMGAAPDTVGGMTMLQNNATAVLRRLARTFDDRVTTPHIRRYYTWLLQWGENDEAKGDYQVVAKGSTALVERDIQAQEISAMGGIVTDVRFGADPKKWFREFLISRHYNPEKFEYDDEEWKAMVEKLSSPPPDPKLEIAQINAQSRKSVAELQAEIAALKEKNKQDMANLQMQFESQENALDREKDILVQQIESGVAQALKELEEAGMEKRNVDQIKQKMTDTVLKLRVQKELSGSEATTPAVEPKGRAPAGQSFTK